MSALPVVSGREVAKALEKIGYVFDRQRGSHIILRHPSPPRRRLTVPDHSEVAKGTLRAITGIDEANLGRFIRGELSVRLDKADRLAADLGLHVTPDPEAVAPTPTPKNLARPTLAKTKAKRKTV